VAALPVAAAWPPCVQYVPGVQYAAAGIRAHRHARQRRGRLPPRGGLTLVNKGPATTKRETATLSRAQRADRSRPPAHPSALCRGRRHLVAGRVPCGGVHRGPGADRDPRRARPVTVADGGRQGDGRELPCRKCEPCAPEPARPSGGLPDLRRHRSLRSHRWSAGRRQHDGLPITTELADRWLSHFRQAIEATVPAESDRTTIYAQVRSLAMALVSPQVAPARSARQETSGPNPVAWCGVSARSVARARDLARRGDVTGLGATLTEAPDLLLASYAAAIMQAAALAGRAETVRLLLDRGIGADHPFHLPVSVTGTAFERVIFVTPLCAARMKRRTAAGARCGRDTDRRRTLGPAPGARSATSQPWRQDRLLRLVDPGELYRKPGSKGRPGVRSRAAAPRCPRVRSRGWPRDGPALRRQGGLPADHRGTHRARRRSRRPRRARPHAARLAGTGGALGTASRGPELDRDVNSGGVRDEVRV